MYKTTWLYLRYLRSWLIGLLLKRLLLIFFQSIIKNEGGIACAAAYKRYLQVVRIPQVVLVLKNDFNSLIHWFTSNCYLVQRLVSFVVREEGFVKKDLHRDNAALRISVLGKVIGPNLSGLIRTLSYIHGCYWLFKGWRLILLFF